MHPVLWLEIACFGSRASVSALGQKRTSVTAARHVRLVPEADMLVPAVL